MAEKNGHASVAYELGEALGLVAEPGRRVTRAGMEARTKRFVLDVIRFCRTLPATEEHRIIKRQLLRSATSVGANYRASQRGRSRAELIAKLGIVIEEADESGYWLELLLDLGDINERHAHALRQEADELTAITVAARDGLRGTTNRES